MRSRQRYRDDTLVLETEFVCDGGGVRVVDFMPMDGRCSVVRVVEGVEGEVPVEMLLDVRFGYGADIPWIELTRDGTRFLAGPDALDPARAGRRSSSRGPRCRRSSQVRKGDRIPMQLTWYPSHEQPPAGAGRLAGAGGDGGVLEDWAAAARTRGARRDAVVRSLLTLKAMTYAPTGGIVAAPTTSLPEEIGGVRNWDYRYCWLRDASLTLDALMIGGYVDEARAFRDWLLRAAAGAPGGPADHVRHRRRASPDRDGSRPGCRATKASKPVRVGNAASGQFQLDVYGEVLSCHVRRRASWARRHGRGLAGAARR